MSYPVRTMGSLAGSFLPTFVTSSDVHALKLRLDPYVRSLARDVAACPGVPADVRASWLSWVNAWAAYFNTEESFFSAAAEMDQGQAYERDLQAWQTKLTSGAYLCAPSSPLPSSVGAADDQTHTTLRLLAATAIVIALVVGVRTVMKK